MSGVKQKQKMDSETSGAAAGGSAGAPAPLNFALTPRSLAGAFAIVVVCLLIAHLGVQTARFVTGDERLYGLTYMFGLGAEMNIPTFYSAFALLFCSGLLAFTGFLTVRTGKPMAVYWFGLALIFMFLASDEMLVLHEKLIDPVRRSLHTSGVFYYAWIIPYALITGAIGGVYVKFLLSLPRRTGIGIVIAGGTFVAGAIGFEMLGGLLYESMGSDNLSYLAAQTAEEALEMIGIVIFIYVIADYVATEFNRASISLGRN